MKYFLLMISFLIVAFGQPAWVPGLGILAAAFGFALFWRGMVLFQSPRDRFFLSMIWFALVQSVQLSWMATVDYMGPLILALYGFLILGLGVQFGILSFFFRERIGFLSAIAIAGSWVIFEWLRLFFFCGFSWNMVGLALTDSPYSLQFASIWGIFGLSFWVILVNLAAFNTLIEKSMKKMALWALMALLPMFFGYFHQNWVESRYPISRHLNIVLVQTALFPEQKEFLSTHPGAYVPPMVQWERIFTLLMQEEQTNPDLIVLPEAALPLGAHSMAYDWDEVKKYFNDDVLPQLQGPYAAFHRGKWRVNNAYILQALSNQFQAHVIVGLDDRDISGSYNAAFHFYPQGTWHERYEKRVLVPIAEYLPLPQWKSLAQFIAREFGIYSSFDAGVEAKIFQAPMPTGVSICLEETFSHLIRDLRLKGAELFVNLTNDVWFPRSKLVQQHFYHGRVRAVENGVPILRACNTGITSAVDCFGKLLAQLPPSEEKASSLSFTVPVRSYPTLYTWWGDTAIVSLCAVSVLSYFLFARKSCRK